MSQADAARPADGNPVDPPDLELAPTVRRLLRLWHEQWRLVAIGLICAFLTTLLALAIPILVSRAIDNVIVPKKTGALWEYLVAILVLASLRLFTNYTRRYATARVGIRTEARLRELLYGAYLRFPRAFYDQHATGQVVSRATNDLYPIRYFIGWGMVQGIQSLLMIVGVAIVLLTVNWQLALIAFTTMPLIAVLAWLFAHVVMPISRRVQERKGDVTEASDEAVVGIQMVQAFGREDDVHERFSVRSQALRSTTLQQAFVEARYLPSLLFLPTLAVAAVLYVGGREVINGTLTIGQFVLFNSLLLQLAWPLEALGWIVNLGQRAIASAGRSFAWLEGIKPLADQRVVAVREVVHEHGDPRRVAGGEHVVPRGVRPRGGEVVAQRHREEDGALRDDGDRAP